ncbi:NADase-type glycan-binding domain-containing protein [Bacteroides pyogenes]
MSASSEMKPHRGIPYAAKNVHDLSYKTAWVEDIQGDSIDEYLIYRFPPTNPRITKVIVISGYSKSDEIRRKNLQVKQRKHHYHQRRRQLA